MFKPNIFKTADCLIVLLYILCLIENKALLAFKLKVVFAVMNLPLGETFTP